VIYLDHNATTPLDERVLEAMLPWLREGFGNPSSPYRLGREARRALERAREQVSALVGAHPSQLIFTSGGSEANSTALAGVLRRRPGLCLSVSAIEHPSLLDAARAEAGRGHDLTLLPCDDQGVTRIDPLDPIRAAGLVSLMWANNETGVVQPLAEVAERVHAAGGLLHCDAVQGLGKQPIDFAATGAQLMSLSAHKIGGPKGAGALVVDKAVDLEPLIQGGGQERGRRGGTENLAAIVGFGAAAALAAERLAAAPAEAQLRDRLEAQLKARIPELVVFGAEAPRLPNTSFFAVPGLEGQTLIMALDRLDIALSSGSACGHHHDAPSHVLAAMGIPAELARCALRISLGPQSTVAEVDRTTEQLAAQVTQLKAFAAVGWA